jgi:hypothetical protein
MALPDVEPRSAVAVSRIGVAARRGDGDGGGYGTIAPARLVWQGVRCSRDRNGRVAHRGDRGALGFQAYTSATIFIETFAICIFAIFWLVKTYEVHIIDTQPDARHADFRAAAGALTDEERNSLSLRLNRSLNWS